MESFVRIEGIATPLLRINIDTDQIIPGPFMIKAYKEGFAGALFGNWRFRPDGSPDPDFILNREPWNKGTILLADRNFGCGSSRETAARSLRAFGFRVVIAPSFGGIFYNNCFQNGLLPVELPIEQIQSLAGQMEEAQGRATVCVDLEAQTILAPQGHIFSFTTPSHSRQMLLNGLDEVECTLAMRETLDTF